MIYFKTDFSEAFNLTNLMIQNINTLNEVLKNQGVVSITSWGKREPHVVNTWNSYLTLAETNRILIPAAAMINTENWSKIPVAIHANFSFNFFSVMSIDLIF